MHGEGRQNQSAQESDDGQINLIKNTGFPVGFAIEYKKQHENKSLEPK